MAEQNTCPDCGATLSSIARAAQCPACLLKLGLGNLFAEEAGSAARSPDSGAFLEGTQFGDYDLLAQIARGGMGVVFRARQRSLNREVAIKMILSGRFASADELRRFRIEAEAAALLDHPNIVPIHDVGQHEDTPYLTMALIDGSSLAERISRSEFTLSSGQSQQARTCQKQIVRLVQTLAAAAHHAHQRGVIHRDLKPANILFDADNQPRIADFGLARQIDSGTLQTASSQLAGTPSYMAPEQARLKSSELTTSVDVYALGAILYELLTGRPPFRGGTALETLHHLLEEEPTDPHSVNPLVDRELAFICLKCLEKEPARRYESAAALAEELQRWIEGRPIEARPTSQIVRLIKWSRRRPAIASLSVFSILALFAFIVLLLVSRSRIEERRLFAEAQKQLADEAANREQLEKNRLHQLLNRLDFDHAGKQLQSGETAEAFAYLAHLVRENPTSADFRRRLLNALLHEVTVVPAAPAWRHPAGINQVAFAPDGARVALAGVHGHIQVLDVQSGDGLVQFVAHSHLITALVFNPEGSRLLSASKDGTARVWDARSGERLLNLTHQAPVNHAGFSPDGLWIVTASDDRFSTRWSAGSGESSGSRKHPAPVSIARFSPDGSLIASADSGGTIKLWRNDSSGRSFKEFKMNGTVNDLRFDPAQRRLAAASSDHAVRVWPLVEGVQPVPPLPYPGPVKSLAFSRDGRRLATAGNDKTARVWHLPSGEPAFPPITHKTEVVAIEFSPDDSLLATTSWDRTARLWNAADGRRVSHELTHLDWIRAARFSPDGRLVVTVSADRSAQPWRLLDRRAFLTLEHESPLHSMVVNEESGIIVSQGRTSGTRLWNLATATSENIFDATPKQTTAMTLSSDGVLVATGFNDGSVRIWDRVKQSEIPFQSGEAKIATSVCFSPDGTILAAGFQNGTLKVWSLSNPGPPLLTVQLEQPVVRIIISPDGKRIAAAASGPGKLAFVSLFPSPVARVVHPPTPAVIRSLAFHPSGRSILAACSDRRARIFDSRTGALISDAYQHEDQVNEAVFSQDAKHVATVSKDGSARIWLAENGALVGQPLVHESAVVTSAFSPDGTLLATGTSEGIARVWSTASGVLLASFARESGSVVKVAILKDGAQLVVADEGGVMRIHPLYQAKQGESSWLPGLAEAVGGLRLDEHRLLQPVSRESYWNLLDEAIQSPLGEAFQKWLPDPVKP